MGNTKGLLIAFEGIDGAGKFTQLQKTKEWLEDSWGFIVNWSSEPNDTSSPLGVMIRKILKRELPKPEDSLEFQRMYILDRAQDIFVYIKPNIEKEKHIYLIERFGLSTIAYGMLAGKPADFFIEMHKQVLGTSLIWPDLTILLDLPAKTAIERISKSRDTKQLFEKEKILEEVRENYLSLVKHQEFKDSIVVVDGSPEPNITFNKVMNVVKSKIFTM